MSQDSLVQAITATEWIKRSEVAKRTGVRVQRVTGFAEQFGIRRLVRPGHRTLYNAQDVANIRVEGFVVGSGTGPDGRPLDANQETESK